MNVHAEYTHDNDEREFGTRMLDIELQQSELRGELIRNEGINQNLMRPSDRACGSSTDPKDTCAGSTATRLYHASCLLNQ